MLAVYSQGKEPGGRVRMGCGEEEPEHSVLSESNFMRMDIIYGKSVSLMTLSI